MIFKIQMRNELQPFFVKADTDTILLNELNAAASRGNAFAVLPDEDDEPVFVAIGNINTIRPVKSDAQFVG